jgi:SNF2 family DNA or RNA helicase
MKAHCDHREIPASKARRGAGLGSKIEALLADLPRNERSVVFSSSKECVKHLIEVLKYKGVACRALFTGQSLQVLKQAVSEWEGPSVPVLLVQSGAAASGLTLTVASKLFIMEPFLRVEEEQQAYARLHRFGQTSAVQVRCYFHPVSVESRLLAWRNSAEELQSKDPAFIDKTLHTIQNIKKYIVEDSEELMNSLGDIESPGEAAQALFLLGLLD